MEMVVVVVVRMMKVVFKSNTMGMVKRRKSMLLMTD